MPSRRVAPAAIVLTLLLAACENSLGPDSVRSVEIEVDRTTLFENTTTSISVSATDMDGGSISSSEVTWISRDPTTVRVEDGALIGVAPGVTTVVADVRGARDSVRVRVRFANLSRGEIGVRLQGERGVRQATGGSTFMHRHLALDGLPTPLARTTIQTRLSGGTGVPTATVDPAFATADTLVHVTFMGDPSVGTRQFESFVADTLNGTFILRGIEGAMVRIANPNQPLRMEVFTPVGPVDLEIDEVTLPAQPGGSGGLMRGAVAFEAAGIVIALDTTSHTVDIVGPASETTLHVYVEFETGLSEWLTGSARVSAVRDGQSAEGFTSAGARVVDGGAQFHLSVATLTAGGELADEVIVLHTRVEANAAGTVAVQSLDGDEFDQSVGAPGTWTFATIFPRVQGITTPDDITGYAYSTGGEISLTEYRAPTESTFGMMRGTYAITLAVRDADNAPTGETMDASAEFIAPIVPTCWLGGTCQ